MTSVHFSIVSSNSMDIKMEKNNFKDLFIYLTLIRIFTLLRLL